jgi:phosphoribosylaminoimidazole-succinocarboxamide synthase
MIQDLQPLYETRIRGLEPLHRGKVRDLYAVNDRHMLMVATDRISAFDVVLPTPIPGKGVILTRISNFWFARTARIVPNHLTGIDPAAVVPLDEPQREPIVERAVVVRRLRPLPVEAIVRGYLIGSGWRDYQRTGAVCGIRLPAGLRLAERLPEPLYTPSTKAAAGEHDENIDFGRTVALLGPEVAEQVRDLSLAIYREAAEYAAARGILIADTKFEFGLDEQGRVVLMDELLTPDSSRFWPAEQWRPGENPPSFDKQYVRDYLERLDWDKRPPGPELPDAVVRNTQARYLQALEILTGQTL